MQTLDSKARLWVMNGFRATWLRRAWGYWSMKKLNMSWQHVLAAQKAGQILFCLKSHGQLVKGGSSPSQFS